MPIAISDFWKLAVASGLLPQDRCRELQAQFESLKGAAQQGGTTSLAEWLVATSALSRYQANVLLSGRPGPFVFGDFTIVERVEAGRLARTFRATYQGSHPAILVFASALGDTPQSLRMAVERYETAKTVKSPHATRVYQFIKSTAPPFFVLEDLRGQSLRERLAAARLTVREACRIGLQATLGLVALHEQGAAHGAICPENVWVEPSGTVKLMQFPLTEPVRGEQQRTLPMVDYLAPEQIEDAQRPADALSDVYSLGCLIFELLTGQVPFPGGSAPEKRARHSREIARRVDELIPEINEDLADLVASMVDKESMLRVQTSAHVAHRLAPFAGSPQQPREARPPLLGGEQRPPHSAVPDPQWKPPPKQATPATVAPVSQVPLANAPVTTPAPVAVPIARDVLPAAPIEKHRTPAPGAPSIVVSSPATDPGRAGAGASRPRHKSSQAMWIGLASAAAMALGALLVVAMMWSRQSPAPADTQQRPVTPPNAPGASATIDQAPVVPPAKPEPAKEGAASQAPVRGAAQVVEIDDDGKALWASPTAGQPLNLRYLPSSAQVFLALRPADLLANPEGAKLLDALGPAGKAAQSHWRDMLGVDWAGIEQWIAAVVPGDDGVPRTAFSLLLGEPLNESTLPEAWGKPEAATHASRRYWKGAELAYYLPEAQAGRLVAIGPQELVLEIIEREAEPLLRKGLEDLVRTSDDQRHFTLIAAPSYLLTDGKSLLAGHLQKLRDPLAEFFDMRVPAVAASAQLGEALFLELRMVAPADVPAEKLALQTRDRLDQASHRIDQYVAALTPGPYGRQIVNRFPLMVQTACNFTRAGAEGRQALLRCYLPDAAGHNLLLGAELALAEPQSSAGAPPAADNAPRVDTPSVQAALARQISLSFPRDTLEHCFEIMAAELGVPIVIVGNDLQLEGITKNQSFALNERDQPAGEILAKVLKLANPDGKLVYVVKPDDAGQETIFVTTRAAAAKRNERPAESTKK